MLAMEMASRKEETLRTYRPYPKQRIFHRLGRTKRERLLRAGNQNGKSYCGGAEFSFHVTGLYPQDWDGHLFDRPILAWAAGETGETTRDNPQRILLGLVGSETFGTGMIPHRLIGEYRPAIGVANLLDYIKVRHITGGWSTVRFKYYAQGQTKWQGPPVDLLWFDEEAPQDVYDEGLARTIATTGIVYTTFTPLKGMSEVVRRFIGGKSEDRADVVMTIYEAEHISKEQREIAIASFPEHEREARANGVPTLGSGRIFPVHESMIKISMEDFLKRKRPTWRRIGGLDFGWDHPTAAVRVWHDADNDAVYIDQAYQRSRATPLEHSPILKAWGVRMPWAWPHDGYQHDRKSGEPLKDTYAGHGLNMLEEHAQFEDGGTGVEAGLMDILERMKTGRFYVVEDLEDWFGEFRIYHRKDGVVVKIDDDLMSATRYAIMELRNAEPESEDWGGSLNYGQLGVI